METKHTPGPWKVIKSPHGPKYKCVQYGKDENYASCEMLPADARLVASAPRLLEALADIAMWSQDCVKIMEMDGNRTLAIGLEMRRRIALSVIAKATGAK